MKQFFMMFLIIFLTNVYCAEFIGTVIKVYDGDTFLVKEEHKTIIDTSVENVKYVLQGKYRIRLADVDAPELTQEFGENSKLILEKLVLNKRVKVVFHQIDVFGRIVGTVYLIDSVVGIDVVNNESVNEYLISVGAVWWWDGYSKRKYLENVQCIAKEKKLGLWKNKTALAPWEFRKIIKKK